MSAALAIILRNPAIRVATITLFASGLTYGATLPYLSIVAIKEFGMSDQMLSVLLFTIAFANLAYGVSVAIFSDMVTDRKPLLLLVSSAGIIGFGAIYALPNITMFMLAAVLLIPLSNASYSLLLSTIRSLTIRMGQQEATAINQMVRAIYSGSWILVPGLVALWLVDSGSLLPAWGISAVACLFCFAMTALFMPRLQKAPGPEAVKISFFGSLRQATAPVMIARICAISLITASGRLNSIIQPLILTGFPGGRITDVGFIAGGVAALEIPFMLLWGMALKRLSVLHVLAIGTVIYAGFLALLSFATSPWHIYVLMIPNACGVSAILSLPLSYYQDLMAERPGLGTSLNQMTSFVATGMTASAFAIGAHYLGYSGSSWIGVVMALAGIGLLLAIESGVTASAGRH